MSFRLVRLPHASRTLLLALAAGAAIFMAYSLIAQAASTPYSCDGNYNYCPPGAKYDRGALGYTQLATYDWRFDTRYYGGSNGCSGISQDRWRLEWAQDWGLNTSWTWVVVGSNGAQSEHSNNCPWSDYTVGSSRTIYGYILISWVSTVRHRNCSPDPSTGCVYPSAWSTWYDTNENSLWP